MWEVPFSNNYNQSIKVIWHQAEGYGQHPIESDVIRPGHTKEIKTSVWRTHTRSNFQFQMFHVVNEENDTLETVFLNSGLIAWLGYNVELPLKNISSEPHKRYDSFLKYCNKDSLSINVVELFVDFTNEEYDKVLKRSDLLLNEYRAPTNEVKEEFKNLAEDIDSANIQAVMLLQVLASEKQGSKSIAKSVTNLKRVYPEVFEHYSNWNPFNKIFESVAIADS